jgi:t-SNARE complex subunit (syntaxin)
MFWRWLVRTLQASDYVHKAKIKLDRALELQSRARHKKICCFVLLLVLIAIIVAAIIAG